MKTPYLMSHFRKLAFTFFLFVPTLFSSQILFAEAPLRVTPIDELLDASIAFKAEIRQRDPNTAELKFTIVPGYYLYRDRLRVEQIGQTAPMSAPKEVKKAAKASKKPSVSEPNNVALSKPEGRPIDDPTFGKVDIYDKTTIVLIDLSKQDKSKDADIKLAVVSQGCAAAGVCFAPQRQIFTLKYQPNALVTGGWVSASKADQISFSQSGLGKPQSSPKTSPVKLSSPIKQ